MKFEKQEIYFWILIFCVIFTGFTGFLLSTMQGKGNSLGQQAVHILYDFDDLDELNENIVVLEYILDESMWDSFTLNSESRVISAYNKFQKQPVRADILSDNGETIIYKVRNDYIADDRRFVFNYEVKNNKLVDIEEYELRGITSLHEGVW